MAKKISDHFSFQEMVCRGTECNCQRADMDPEFMMLLEEVRKAYGKPMYISSAFRCDVHNNLVSSIPNGPHTHGKAADVLVSGQNAMDLFAAAKAVGAYGLGVSQKGPHRNRFLHIDGDESRTAMWSY